MKLVIFWDFDAQWGAERSRSPGGEKDWGIRDFENTERLLDILAEYNVKACFAIVGAVGLPGARPYHDPDLIKRISFEGHEIASHGLNHEWIPGMGLGACRRMLVMSKEILEKCIGQPVTSFVPPYNQPFDFPSRGSFSISERRAVPVERINIPILCDLLAQTGYTFTRISYASCTERLFTILGIRKWHRKTKIEKINGVTALRLIEGTGFGTDVLGSIREGTQNNRTVAVYGHPHSLTGHGSQSEVMLIPFLQQITEWRRRGQLDICLPSSL